MPFTTKLVLLFSFCLSTSHALRNVTVDNTSPLITYQGPWPANAGGFVGYDVDDTQETIDVERDGPSAPSATATFTFTGIAIYYWSPLWPYDVRTMVTLDNESPVVVSLVDSRNLVPIGSTGPSVISQIRWGRTGLSNTQHTLTMSLVPQSRYIVVDALTYTALDPSDTVSIVPPVSATKSTTESSASLLVISASSPTTAHPSGSSSSLTAGATGGSGSSHAGSFSSPTQATTGDPYSPLSDTIGPNHSRSKTLIIVASTLGSLFFVAVLAILILVLRRRRTRREDDTNASLSPFLVDTVDPPVTRRCQNDVMEASSTQGNHSQAPANPTIPCNPRVSMLSTAYTTAPPPYQHLQDTAVRAA